MAEDTYSNRFEVGKKYYRTDFHDAYDVRKDYKVLRRTKATVTMEDDSGRVAKLRITPCAGVETVCIGFKRYLFADRVVDGKVAKAPKVACVWDYSTGKDETVSQKE